MTSSSSTSFSSSHSRRKEKDEGKNLTQTQDSLFDFTAPKDPKANQGSRPISPIPGPPNKREKMSLTDVDLEHINSGPKGRKTKAKDFNDDDRRRKKHHRSEHKRQEKQETNNEEEEQQPEVQQTPEQVAESLIKGTMSPELVETEIMPDVVTILQRTRDDHLFDHNVDLAQRADELSVEVKKVYRQNLKIQNQREAVQSIEARLKIAEMDLQSLEKRCRRTMHKMRAQHKKSIERMEERHANEIEEFVDKWQQPKTIKKYSAASSKLRFLRNQNINLMMLRRYDELKMNDKELKSLERIELNEQFRTMSMSYDAQLQVLQEKQKEEMDTLIKGNAVKEEELQAAADKEIYFAKNRVQALERMLVNSSDPDKLWNRYPFKNQKGATARSLAQVKIPRPQVNQLALNTLALPPLGDPRAQTQQGFRRRMQAPVFLC